MNSHKYRKQSHVFTATQVENEEHQHLLLDPWYEKHAAALNGRNIRITIQIEPSPEDRAEDRFERE